MAKYITKRILKGIVTFLITITLTFFIVRLMPADPATLLMDPRMSEAHRQQLLKDFGLDKPLIVQYFSFLRNLLKGDLGISFMQKRPVMDIIMEKLPWTLLLMTITQFITMAVGIPLGIYSGHKRGSLFDQIVNAVAIFGISIFVPWLGFTLLYIFGYNLAILPIGGAHTPGIDGGLEYFLDVGKHLILPVITLMSIYLANYVLYTRGSVIDVLSEDYIRTARSKGMKEMRVLWKHASKNAMIPTVTTAGLMIGRMVGGAVLTETVFAYPGVGRMIYQAVSQQDFPILQGAFIILALSVIIMNIITDILCAYLDPRIKLE
ncbi:MAG TPA: ABC transporter permease [Tissierellia bacterium]|nr:ABC transporter permease [Clostridiales bacterium]HHV46760.1 ABC transporter permease [Tissierellia bacterium]